MGQSHDKMGQPQSKEELLYQYVTSGNVEAVATLCGEGANIEWIDQKGRTPLILACLNSELLDVAETLIRFNANLDAYRAGRKGGTPLHHAAKRGLEQTVRLLLSSGANALVTNDECQTPLDIARTKRHTSVVRTIENHICYFSGWMRELHGPGFLEALAPQLLPKKRVWVVVTPRGASSSLNPPKLELSIYHTLMDSQPRAIVSLWNAKMEEPRYNQSDPALTIVDPSTKARHRLASGKEGDKMQLQSLYNACKGISENSAYRNATDGLGSMSSGRIPNQINTNGWADSPGNSETHNGWDVTSPGNSETHNGWDVTLTPLTAGFSEIRNTGWMAESRSEGFHGWGDLKSASLAKTAETCEDASASGSTLDSPSSDDLSSHVTDASKTIAPSAPPIPEQLLETGRVHYPDVELGPVEIAEIDEDSTSTKLVEGDEGDLSLCVICWEAAVEGACVPCGHMAGCMVCLNEIQAKDGTCPVCRTPIDKVLRIFAV